MKDEDKTKEQTIKELASLRESLCRCAADLQARNQDLDDVARYVISEFRSPVGMIVGFAELLDEEYATLSEEERHHCTRTIKQNGHKMTKMVNALLLLANSRRLFDNVWYAAYLAVMGEPSLSQWALEAGENVSKAYRFTCLPASSAPLVIRVWATGGETVRFQAIAKLGSGRGEREGETGPLSQETEWTLASEKWDSLLAAIEESKFWTDASSLEQLGWLRMVGTGGEEWIFEGWRDGQYKARAVWNPDDERARAAYVLCRALVNLLPEQFALEMARFWAADSWPEIHQRFENTIERWPIWTLMR